MRKLPAVTSENYFDQETSMAYMSASQFKSFLQCEAMALAELRGEWTREPATALLVGAYVDAHYSGELDSFKQRHPAIFTRNGELKSEYRKAEGIIARADRDRLFTAMMAGQKQVIKTGKIASVPFKIKIDSLLSAADCKRIMDGFPAFGEYLLFAEGAINDLKIMRDLEQMWVPGTGKASFVQAWGYDLQLAVYQEIEGNRLPCFITAATKEDEPNLEVFVVPQDEMDARLLLVEELAPRFAAIKRGEIEPDRCGRCAYCRSTKVLTGPQDYRYYGGTEEAV